MHEKFPLLFCYLSCRSYKDMLIYTTQVINLTKDFHLLFVVHYIHSKLHLLHICIAIN